MTYEGLLDDAFEKGLIVKEKPLKANKGRIKGNKIAISKDIDTTVEKACVLLEEIGHYYTTVGDITDQSTVGNVKQEKRARKWAYEMQIPPARFIDAYRYGCSTIHEVSLYLELPEEFLIDAVKFYNSKYGKCMQFDRFIIYFEPLGVLEIFK